MTKTWAAVVEVLMRRPWRNPIRVAKSQLPHPRAVGMKPSVGMPLGQVADYRYALESNAGLHVRDFGHYWEAHLDEVHPDVDPVEHVRRDAPVAFIAGAVALGAVAGGMLGKSWQSALAGAAIVGLAGIALSPAAKDKG